MLVPMLLIFLIFYFLLIRPQQRQQREQETLLKGIEKGDDVVTAGGLHGKVIGVTDDVLTLEIARAPGRARARQGEPLEDRERAASPRRKSQGEEGRDVVSGACGCGSRRWPRPCCCSSYFAAANCFSEQTRLASPLIPDAGIRLGLDLQGGIHWVVGVKLDAAVAARARVPAQRAGRAARRTTA